MMKSAIMGFCTGDVLGLPLEGISRKDLKENPVYGIRPYGGINEKKGTWSDCTSLTLCVLDSIRTVGRVDYTDIMERFVKWISDGKYTPWGEVIHVSKTTRDAIYNYLNGENVFICGNKKEMHNGNGALIRMLPLAFYVNKKFKNQSGISKEGMALIENVTRITHRNERNIVGCTIYVVLICRLLEDRDFKKALRETKDICTKYFGNNKNTQFIRELEEYERIFDDSFESVDYSQISSSSYIVDTLESAIWSVLTTNSIREAILKAANLGGDTKGICAITGGFAGIIYGYKEIPKEWLEVIPQRGFIEDLCDTQEIKPGLYRHYKGGTYQVICVAKQKETMECQVVYQNSNNNEGVWVIPASKWREVVETENGDVIRFSPIVKKEM
ncbi:MAG: DUF1653 domain-containing protein [Anaerovoracaceae bacterium]